MHHTQKSQETQKEQQQDGSSSSAFSLSIVTRLNIINQIHLDINTVSPSNWFSRKKCTAWSHKIVKGDHIVENLVLNFRLIFLHRDITFEERFVMHVRSSFFPHSYHMVLISTCEFAQLKWKWLCSLFWALLRPWVETVLPAAVFKINKKLLWMPLCETINYLVYLVHWGKPKDFFPMQIK